MNKILTVLSFIILSLTTANLQAESKMNFNFLTTAKYSQAAEFTRNEPIRLTISWPNTTAVATVTVKATADFTVPHFEQKFNTNNQNELTIEVPPLNRSGFVMLDLTLKDNAGKTIEAKQISAGVDIENITSGAPVPEDFDSFWQNALQEGEKVDLAFTMVKSPELSTDQMECYQVSFNNIDQTKMYGFLGVPTGKGPYPAQVVVYSAGPSINDPREHFADGFITLFLNVHSYEPFVSNEEIEKRHKLINEPVPYYLTNADNRNKFFFKKVYVGAVMAIRHLMNMEKFDGQNIGIFGSSQGAGSALILTALVPEIKFCVANVPALCDHNAIKQQRRSGWPQFFEYYKNDEHILREVQYFDAANFATKIKVPVIIIAGGIDTTCPPATVAAAFNNIPSRNKTFIHESEMGHDLYPSYDQACKTMREYVQSLHAKMSK